MQFMSYLSKIGFLHYLLNKQYPIIIRFFISLVYFFICITTTLDLRLSFIFFKRVLLKNDLKSESRRLVWIIKRKIFILENTDIMFDFCSGLNLKEISILKSYFMKLKISSENLFTEIDLLKILAYECNFLEDPKSNSILFEQFKNQYLKVKKLLVRKNIQKDITLKNNKSIFSKRNIGISSKKAQKVLKDINQLFKRNKIEWFPISGTFLGFIREKSFLGHDLDIDIGLLDKNISFEKIKNIMRKNNIFKISKIEYQKCFIDKNNFLNKPTFARIIHKNGINVDLYFHFKKGNYIYHGTSSILWKNTLFELCDYKIYGMKIRGPADNDLYLTETYGDWRKEKINYDFHRDMMSLEGAPNFLGLEYLLRRKLYCGEESRENLSSIEKLVF